MGIALTVDEKESRINEFKNYLEEALMCLDEHEGITGIRLAKRSVEASLRSLGKIGSLPKRTGKAA